MLSLYRIAGGLAFVLMGIGYFQTLPPPFPIAIGILLVIAGVALLAGF
jgi:hypothetical protein